MSNANELKELLKNNPVAAWLDERAKLALKEAGIDEKKETAPEPETTEAAPKAEGKDEKEAVPREEPDPFARQFAEIDKAREELRLHQRRG